MRACDEYKGKTCMIDFFNALSDLLGSDLVKDNKSIIAILLVIVIVVSCFLTWIVCSKVFLQIRLNKAADKERQYSEIQEKVHALEKRNLELVEQIRKYNLEKVLDYDETTAFEDSALDQFKRRKK